MATAYFARTGMMIELAPTCRSKAARNPGTGGPASSVDATGIAASVLPNTDAGAWSVERGDAIRVRPIGTKATPAAGIAAASMARRCQTPSPNPEAFLFASQPGCQATGRAGGVAQANTPRGRALVTEGSGTQGAALTRRAVNTSKRAR
jgi:hypothetical protein